ncbi:hypothetical protein LCGC14_1808310 [marine sediment metagenome]|uniref:Uncharacterized protein n=1 Tax=marine sediment metagenome TaxID=412755 RepID=A0A0F9GMQ1_9ZZZZ
MTKKILNFYASVETIVTQLVRLIVSVTSFSIGELAPLTAPLAPSFSIYLAMSERLHMPAYIALIAAGTIEIVGMYSAKISVRCYRWNSGRGKSEAAVPQGLSIAMTGIFYLVVLSMALTIELIPSLVSLIFPMFTLISIAVYVNMAIDQNLRKLEIDKTNDIADRKVKTGLTVEIKQAKIYLETVRDNISQAQQAATDNATEAQQQAQQLGDEIDIQAAKLEALTVKETKLKADIVQLQKQRKSEKSATATDAPTATGDDTTQQARSILTEIRRNGSEISGAELGRRLGKSGTLGRKLKNELWDEAATEGETIAQPNGKMEAN